MNPDFSDLDLRNFSEKELEETLTRGVVRALRAHKAASVSAIVWDREKDEIVTVPPDQIPDFPGEDVETQGHSG